MSNKLIIKDVILTLERVREQYRDLIKNFSPLVTDEDKIRMQIGLIGSLEAIESTTKHLVVIADSVEDEDIIRVMRLLNSVYKGVNEVFTLYFENPISDVKNDKDFGIGIQDLLNKLSDN